MKIIFDAIAKYIRQTDRLLWALCAALSAFSLLLIYGLHATGTSAMVGLREVAVQGIAAAAGGLCAIILSKFNYHTLCKTWYLHAVVCYSLMVLTFFYGEGTAERLSDKSWLRVPGIDITVQPTELLKISFILMFAYHIYKVHDHIDRPSTVLLLALHAAIPVALIHFQGDDGTALVFIVIILCMLFASGISWIYIGIAAVAGLIAVPVAWKLNIINSYQKQRIVSLYDPNTNLAVDLYQQYRAKLAIGSGKVFGKGVFATDHKYVPAEHNDFIFSFIGESFGFVGCLALVIALAIFCARLLFRAHGAPDVAGRLVCVGVFGMFAAQIVVNIGMNLLLLPVVGITLPFLSYGGSAMFSAYLGLGIVLSVQMHSSSNVFSS